MKTYHLLNVFVKSINKPPISGTSVVDPARSGHVNRYTDMLNTSKPCALFLSVYFLSK